MLTYVAFPPYSVGEAAYVFAVPLLLWAYRRPPFKIFAWTVVGAQVVAWTLLLGWLHNVTWVGLFLLGPFVGLIIGVWYLAAWWTIPRLAGHHSLVRVIILLGLAALWVLLGVGAQHAFWRFPWLPLAAQASGNVRSFCKAHPMPDHGQSPLFSFFSIWAPQRMRTGFFSKA